MDYTEIQILLLVIISFQFIIDLVSGLLNYSSFDKPLPNNVENIFSENDKTSIFENPIWPIFLYRKSSEKIY